VWRTVARGNEYVDRQAPWKLAKDPAHKTELDRTLTTLVRRLARQGAALAPFMPRKADDLWRALGAPGSVHDFRWSDVSRLDPAGWRVTKGEPLFPRAVRA
jgi:methionyl-tRNA synthetase